MYSSISNAAKTALKSNVVTTTARITLTSGNTVIDGNNLVSVTITDQCYENGVIVGTAMCKEVQIELIDNNYDLADKEFSLEVGVLLPNNSYEYIPYGNFIVKEYKKIVSSNHYNLIAYDYMDKFNKTFVDSNTYESAMTLQQFYQYVANQYGVTIETQANLPNASFSITQKPYFDGMSGRTVLSRIAEIMGCFAKINRNNKLEMRLKNTTSEQFSRAEMNNSLERDNQFGPINVVALRLSQVEGENVTKRDETSIAQYGETTLQIQDNPFVYTEALRLSAINAIYNKVDGFKYYPTTFNGKLIYLDCGDEVEVQDMSTDTYYKTIILKQVLKIPSTRQSKFENKALTDTGLEYQYTPEQVRTDRRTEYVVDKQNGTITQLVETTEDIEQDVQTIMDTTGEAEGKIIHLEDCSDDPLILANFYGETSQTGTPTPSNIIPINNFEGINRLNLENLSPTLFNNLVITVADQQIKIDGTATSGRYTWIIFTKNSVYLKNGTPTSSEITEWADGIITEGVVSRSIEVLDGTSTYTITMSLFDDTGSSVNTPTSTTKIVAVGLYLGNAQTYTNYKIGLQLQYGATASTYIPYNTFKILVTDENNTKQQVVYFPLAEGQKLYDGSYLADDGVHNIKGQIKLTGREYWVRSNLTFQIYSGIFPYNVALRTADTKAYSNMYKYGYYSSGITTSMQDNEFGWSGAKEFTIRDDNYTTVEAWTTYLSDLYANDTPVIIEYELADEEVVPYTEEQQNAWNEVTNITMYKNITNIYSDAYARIEYVKDNGLDIYETRANANRKYTATVEKFAQQKITNESIISTVNQTITTSANNYNELKTKFDDYAPVSDVISLQTSVNQIISDTYTKTEVNEKLIDGSVQKVLTTAGTFDSNGLTIEKTNAKTKGNFNETGITVTDATSGTDEELLFAGYDEELNETIVRTKNITVGKYFTLKDTIRMEYYENQTLGGHGVGFFLL